MKVNLSCWITNTPVKQDLIYYPLFNEPDYYVHNCKKGDQTGINARDHDNVINQRNPFELSNQIICLVTSLSWTIRSSVKLSTERWQDDLDSVTRVTGTLAVVIAMGNILPTAYGLEVALWILVLNPQVAAWNDHYDKEDGMYNYIYCVMTHDCNEA